MKPNIKIWKSYKVHELFYKCLKVAFLKLSFMDEVYYLIIMLTFYGKISLSN